MKSRKYLDTKPVEATLMTRRDLYENLYKDKVPPGCDPDELLYVFESGHALPKKEFEGRYKPIDTNKSNPLSPSGEG